MLKIEKTNAFESKIKTIIDKVICATSLVDIGLPVDLIVWKNDIRSNRGPSIKQLVNIGRYLAGQPLLANVVFIRVRNGIAAKKELAKF